MKWRNIGAVYTKELRDMLRDRRTLLSMILVPTLLMPLLMAGMGFISYKVVRQARSTLPTVMVIGGDDSPRLQAALAGQAKFRTEPASADWRTRISEKKIRAVIEIPPGFDAALARAEPAAIRIYHYEGEMRSGFAVAEVRRFFNEYREAVIASRLAGQGLPASFVRPFELRTENVAPPEKVGGNVVGGVIPYLFILLAFTGAMYPAIDLTAGEKERGTMETILCSPIGRTELVLGKFFMVLTASLATVAFSLVSMGATLLAGSAMLGRTIQRGTGAVAGVGAGGGGAGATLPSLDPLGMLAVLGMVAPMAVLFSAGLLAISLFAKSYKEAQSYVSPLILVIILPAVAGLLPGVELNSRLALVPVLNVSLVSKELVSGVWHWGYLALIFGSSCVYAVIALWLAVRMFHREDVIFRT